MAEHHTKCFLLCLLDEDSTTRELVASDPNHSRGNCEAKSDQANANTDRYCLYPGHTMSVEVSTELVGVRFQAHGQVSEVAGNCACARLK
jgi:hypothetical protein